MSSPKKVAIVNVRTFDGRSIGDLGTVVIDGHKIGTDASGAIDVDGMGGVLLPGFIDCHVHLSELEYLEKLSSYGVTTALDMGMNSIDVLRSLKGHAGLTDIRGCGMFATNANSRHSRFPGLSPPPESLIQNPQEAATFIKNSEETDYVKIVVDYNVLDGLSYDIILALVTNAHQYGKLTIAHTTSFESVRLAQKAGVDFLTHSPMDKKLDDDAITTMVREGRKMVPTLGMMEEIIKKRPPLDYSNPQDSVTAAYKAGVPILVGTDANMASGVPANVPFGDSLHHEMEMLVRAGMSTVDVLRGATSLPAKYFGLEDRGVIQPGKRADLVLIGGNPIEDIRATRSIKRVWCGGIEKENVISE
ncbi:MAG: hypothetical protein CYPHOPRED_001284 [Cyphobasidiales sp. Tagirdzhanova-0007]|nr:MAG: hypothetical protein CYPHOPRED_001284 [Cyphobasidiales sp. Tagirdzhanova-0007]